MEQLNSLKKHLNSLTQIPPTQWLRISMHLRLRLLKKSEFYFRQNEPFDEIGFVLKGLLYNSQTNVDGEEVVSDFRKEGDMVTCYSDLLRQTSASFSSKALESCVLVTIKYAEILKLYDAHPCWDRIGRINAERLFAAKERREQSFMNLDAKERYEMFLQDHRGLHNRVPQYLIASYIGVTPVSLSRIRGKTTAGKR